MYRETVKHVSAPGSHSTTHLHRSDLLREPQHDLETFCGSYRNVTGTVGPGGNNMNAVTGNAMHSGRAESVEGVLRHQLSSGGFTATSVSVSSISGGVVCDAFPCPAIALTPWPVSSHSQILGSDSVLTATAVEVLKQPESGHSMSPSHTILDHGRCLALGPSRVQASGKTSATVASKAPDIYEFHDEDDSEFAGMSIGFRRGKLSGSAMCAPRTSHISLRNNSQPIGVGDANKRCYTASETRAGTTSAPQNVATIFDMDSKSIHRISLPVKHEPLYLNVTSSNSVPLTVMDETLSHLTPPSPQNEAQRRKHSLPSTDASHKRARLNSSMSSLLNFENGGSNNRLPPHIQDLISNVRKMNNCGSGTSAFDSWPESYRLSQPVNSTLGLQPLSFETMRCPDRMTCGYMAVKPVDVPIRSSVANASCSEVMKYKNEPFSSVSTGQFSVAMQSSKSPYMRSVNENVAGVTNNMYGVSAIKPVPVIEKSMYPGYAGSEYYVDQQNRMSVSQQARSHGKVRNKYESDTKWLHAAKTDQSSAVRSTRLEQNTSRNVSLEGGKKRDIVSESSQHDALSYVLDLSCTDSQVSASHVTHGHSFQPNLSSSAAAASRNSDNEARQRVTGGLPYHPPYSHYSHHQLQSQKQLALNVKKEDIGETKMMTDEEKLADRLKRNTIEEAPHCLCRGLMLIVNNLSSPAL